MKDLWSLKNLLGLIRDRSLRKQMAESLEISERNYHGLMGGGKFGHDFLPQTTDECSFNMTWVELILGQELEIVIVGLPNLGSKEI